LPRKKKKEKRENQLTKIVMRDCAAPAEKEEEKNSNWKTSSKRRGSEKKGGTLRLDETAKKKSGERAISAFGCGKRKKEKGKGVLFSLARQRRKGDVSREAFRTR